MVSVSIAMTISMTISVTVSMAVSVAVVAISGLSSSVSYGGRLSLPLAIVAVGSVSVAMTISMAISMTVAMTVAIAGLSQDTADKGKRKNSQQLHDVFGSRVSIVLGTLAIGQLGHQVLDNLELSSKEGILSWVHGVIVGLEEGGVHSRNGFHEALEAG